MAKTAELFDLMDQVEKLDMHESSVLYADDVEKAKFNILTGIQDADRERSRTAITLAEVGRGVLNKDDKKKTIEYLRNEYVVRKAIILAFESLGLADAFYGKQVDSTAHEATGTGFKIAIPRRDDDGLFVVQFIRPTKDKVDEGEIVRYQAVA